VDTSDEWIKLRTGISERRIASPDETLLDMASHAAMQALKTTAAEDIGVVIAATITPDYLTPSLSCLLQQRLGLPEDIIALDLNAACSGFVAALNTAMSLLRDRPGKTALVLGAEMLSRITDYSDRSTCILFGDGAGAAGIGLSDTGEYVFSCGARGGSDTLSCRLLYQSENPIAKRDSSGEKFAITMNGSEVFRFAVESSVMSVKHTLKQAGRGISEIDHFIFHQANRRIIDAIAKRLNVSSGKTYVNIEKYGNTSSATCAISLDEMTRSGIINPGERVVISAFGGGLTYATLYFEY